jgi:hypothetical protein
MSEPFKTLNLKQSRASKIQIEVKEIVPQTTTRKNTTSQLNVDSDGGDLSNE